MPCAAVSNSVRRSSAFIERGLASAVAAKQSGDYVDSATVLGKLAQRLEKARREAGSTA